MSWDWLNFRRRALGGTGIPACAAQAGMPVPPSQWNVVMYTRQGCHLCEQAWRQLERAQQDYRFALHQVDVDTDAQLAREHGECVPVVVVNGRVRFRGIINPVLLKRLFASPV
jgi:glutaredoxin